MPKPPFITIVIPVRNEERFIKETLLDILRQDYPVNLYEIIVADGLSTDKTHQIVEEMAVEYPQVNLVSNPGRLSSSGRNIGFKIGKGDIFLVIDGHCKIEDTNLLKSIVASFKKSGAQCLGRTQPLNPPGVSDFQKAVAIARESRIGHSSKSLIYSDYEGYVSPVSHGAIYKREVFDKVGYVDESFDACEDVEFNYRVEKAGLKTYMSPSLAIKYYPRETLGGLFMQMMRYGAGRFNFLKAHPESLNMDVMLPSIFFIGFIILCIGLILTLANNLGRKIFNTNYTVPIALIKSLYFLYLLYLIYFLMILISAIRLSFREGWKYFRYLLPIFITIHIGLGIGFVRGIMKLVYTKLASSQNE